jgi:hypothetical protein
VVGRFSGPRLVGRGGCELSNGLPRNLNEQRESENWPKQKSNGEQWQHFVKRQHTQAREQITPLLKSMATPMTITTTLTTTTTTARIPHNKHASTNLSAPWDKSHISPNPYLPFVQNLQGISVQSPAQIADITPIAQGHDASCWHHMSYDTSLITAIKLKL